MHPVSTITVIGCIVAGLMLVFHRQHKWALRTFCLGTGVGLIHLILALN